VVVGWVDQLQAFAVSFPFSFVTTTRFCTTQPSMSFLPFLFFFCWISMRLIGSVARKVPFGGAVYLGIHQPPPAFGLPHHTREPAEPPGTPPMSCGLILLLLEWNIQSFLFLLFFSLSFAQLPRLRGSRVFCAQYRLFGG
jgi:hypothetical protein